MNASHDAEPIDLYTPWREAEASLGARHVNRETELAAIEAGSEQLAAGQTPLPLYLFGPRGAGKSHLLALTRHRLANRFTVALIPEDIATARKPERLLARVEAQLSRVRRAAGRREVVLLEGFDRHLQALGKQGRRALRRMLDEKPEQWWITTGVTLPPELTGKDEAFYGAFDPWPLEPLEPADAARLLDTLADGEAPRWVARRNTLVTVAGGNPRALVALGRACREHPSRWASDQLHAVIRDFTAHYQMRFRDLSPQAQQIVEILAEAPGEVTPSELAEALESTTSQMSVQANRLVDEGHLRQRSEGRQSFYRLAEPLFRYWLEYRTATWAETRTGWLSRLLEAMMSPVELADAWWEHPSGELRAAVVARMRPGDEAVSAAWRHLLQETREADVDQVKRAIGRAAELPPSPAWRALAARALEHDLGRALEAITIEGTAGRGWALNDLADLAAVLRFEAHLRRRTASPRDGFLELIETLSRTAEHLSTYDREMLLNAVVAALGQHRRGGPWKLQRRERERLATVPGLRAYFAEHGRLPSHPPLISADDIAAVLQPNVPDAARLIVVAAVHDHAPLLQAAARAFGEASDFTFPPCPTPATPLDRNSAEAVVDAANRTLGAGTGPLLHMLARVVVSWSASLAEVDEERFATLAGYLKRAADAPLDAEGDELALAVLATRSPTRFEALSNALGPRWRDTCDDARRLARTLRTSTGRLHPELERIRAQLEAGA